MEKKFTLKLTAAIAMAGVLHHPNDAHSGIVDLDEGAAKNLLQRGKARVPTEDELRAAGREVPTADTDEVEGPTRADLDAALQNDLADQDDPDYVVRAMRGHFGDLFNDADEATVRERVKKAADTGASATKTAKAAKATK